MKVTLISHTMQPASVCDMAAKTCTSGDMSRVIPEYFDTEKRALARAIESGHESVLEHANFTFAIEGISRACSHQLVRHRMASYSQQSQRYVKMDGFEYVVPPTLKDYHYQKSNYETVMDMITTVYKDMISAGIPEEDARYILPNACTTNIVVTMNARELRHFFSLRCCTRAQWEIRELAYEMLKICQNVAPELFGDVGPQCVKLRFCPEAKGCGAYPPRY